MTDQSSSPGAALAALRRDGVRVCQVCKRPFAALRTAKYCSNRCRQAAKYRRVQEARRAVSHSGA